MCDPGKKSGRGYPMAEVATAREGAAAGAASNITDRQNLSMYHWLWWTEHHTGKAVSMLKEQKMWNKHAYQSNLNVVH
jgi:hypothetical protein